MDRIKKAKTEKIGNGIGDNTGISWSVTYAALLAKLEFQIEEWEKDILRELAKKVAELAELPCQQEKISLWKAHHSLKQTRPIIFCDPETAWYEIIPADELKCRNDLARVWEFRLKKEIYWAENIKDDRPVQAQFTVHHIWSRTSRGMESKTIGGESGGAYNWESPLKNGYELLSELVPAKVNVDTKRTTQIKEIAHDVFDGILEVKLEGVWWWSLGMTSDFIYLRGFENMLMDFYDYPDEVHELMAFLRDENLEMLDYLEKNDLLTLNNTGDYHGTGGYSFTDELPRPGFDGKVTPMEMWGYCESQETVGVSPQIFEEFILPYQKDILKRFGLNIYGCCEPLDTRWESVKTIERLRKVTVSPWSNDELMSECLGKDYVYCKKVNPSLIAVSSIDENEIRKELRSVFDNTNKNDCPTEVLMRDVMTLGGNPYNASKWVQIAREESLRR